MSRLVNDRITLVKPFAQLPPLGNLPGIKEDPSVPSATSRRGGFGGVDLIEACFVTNVVQYINQLAHMVNAIRNKNTDRTELEDFILHRLRIIPSERFTLNDPCNLAYLDPSIHASFDLYALIAVTGSLLTLENLIGMVRKDNCKRQLQLDEIGNCDLRSLNFSSQSFTSPEYELFALHPKYFHPQGAVVTLYGREAGTRRDYVPATDECLRESANITSPRLPLFRHVPIDRPFRFRLNVFLVIMNADIKFQHYFRLNQSNTLPSLPNDVITLMRRTMELVELLYWTPTPTEGSVGQKIVEQRVLRRPNEGGSKQPHRSVPSQLVESKSREEEDVDIGAAPK